MQKLGAVTPIAAYTTGDKYRQVWSLACRHKKEEYERFDVEELRGEDIRDFMEEDVIEAGLTLTTFETYAAGLKKLETALNMYSLRFNKVKRYDFRSVIEELRATAYQEIHPDHVTREYRDPNALIRCINGKPFVVGASIQSQGGARIPGNGSDP